MAGWIDRLKADPIPWLLEESEPAVRHQTLRLLLDRPANDPEVVAASEAAMRSDPIAAILAAQSPEGWWVRPGNGYQPKYTSTVWQVMFLDQMGADGHDPRVRAGCEYILGHSQAAGGGFSFRGQVIGSPEPSGVAHCLNGNLLRALIGFGWLDDPRVQASLDWQTASITGDGVIRFCQSATSGPGFRCAMNYGDPCAWGAVKALLALARVPAHLRTPNVARAIEQGTDFLLSRDPAIADYPMGPNATPSGSWFKLGFPVGYITDVLQTLEALCEAGAAEDPRLDSAVQWVIDQQNAAGRWSNRHSYASQTAVKFEAARGSSKWVTLRACGVLKAMAGDTKSRRPVAPALRDLPRGRSRKLCRFRAWPRVGRLAVARLREFESLASVFDEVEDLRQVTVGQADDCVCAAVVDGQATGRSIQQSRAREDDVRDIPDLLV